MSGTSDMNGNWRKLSKFCSSLEKNSMIIQFNILRYRCTTRHITRKIFAKRGLTWDSGSISVRLSLAFVSQLFVEPPCMSYEYRICNENLLCQRALALWSDIWLEMVRSDEHVYGISGLCSGCRVTVVITL